MLDKARKPIGAGQAYLDSIKHDPAAQAALRRTQIRLRAFQLALSAAPSADKTLVNIWQRLQEPFSQAKRRCDRRIARIAKEYGVKVQRAQAEWQRLWGERYPLTLEDWTMQAMRVCVDPNRILDGNWTLAEMHLLLEGYLNCRMDELRASLGKPPKRVLRARKGGRPRISGRDESYRLEILAAWDKAKRAGTPRWNFCLGQDISLDDLKRLEDWRAKRRQRGVNTPAEDSRE